MCHATIVVLSRLAIPEQEDAQLAPPPGSPGGRTGGWFGCLIRRRFPDAARRAKRSTPGIWANCYCNLIPRHVHGWRIRDNDDND
jgi:hypothetical protein